jgi:hypothetical protein
MPYANNEISIRVDDRGAILVVVLVVLIIAMITFILIIKSTIVENRIAGNDFESQRAFYRCEAAGEVVKANFDEIMSTIGITPDVPVTISDHVNGTGQISGAEVTITYKMRRNPPINSGTSANLAYANYYVIETSVSDKKIRKGVWRAFPRNE